MTVRIKPALLLLLVVFTATLSLGRGVAPAAAQRATPTPAPRAADGVMLPGRLVELRYEEGQANTFVPPPTLIAGQRSTSFAVNYTGFTPEAQAAFQYAVNIWASLITSPVPIVVNANWTVLAPGVLGSAGPATFTRDFAAAPQPDTWYPIALANKLSGTDIYPALHDITANFSSAFTWYYGTDGNAPAGSVDFVSVVMHELGHGLGFVGSAQMPAAVPSNACTTAGQGCWGLNDGSGVWRPTAYDRLVVNGSNQTVTNTALFPNPSTGLAGQITGGDLFFSGTQAAAANGDVKPKLYAPTVFAPGSSFSHLDEATYTWGNANSLMTPSLTSNEAIHSPGPITAGMFTDLGWTATATNPAPVLTSIAPVSATPGGTAFTLTVTGSGFVPLSTVRWNGTNRATIFGSATQLTAQITAADIAAAGTASVTVFTAGPPAGPAGGGTSTAQTFAIGSASCSGVTVTPSIASPQAVGTSVRWTASAAGCPAARYQFWTLAPGVGATWTVAQPFSATATFDWSTTNLAAGTYVVSVWAKQDGSSPAAGYQAAAVANFALTMGVSVCTSATVTPSPASPRPVGTPVTLTASATGCPNPQYQFWLQAPGSATWTIVQPFSADSDFVWTTGTAAPGTWTIVVWARQAGSAAPYEAYGSTSYIITN